MSSAVKSGCSAERRQLLATPHVRFYINKNGVERLEVTASQCPTNDADRACRASSLATVTVELWEAASIAYERLRIEQEQFARTRQKLADEQRKA